MQALQQQEAALQVQASHVTLRILKLRRELSSGWTVAEPHILQVVSISTAGRGIVRVLEALIHMRCTLLDIQHSFRIASRGH